MRDKMMYVAFGRRFNPSALTAAREAKEYTKTRLAQEVFGSTPKSGFNGIIGDYENGKLKPRLDTLQALCDVLGCTVNDSAPKVGEDKPITSTDNRLKRSKTGYKDHWHWG